MEAIRKMREEGGEDCDLLERIRKDEAFKNVAGEIDDIVEPKRLIGRAPEQVDEFLEEELEPALSAYPEDGDEPDVRV